MNRTFLNTTTALGAVLMIAATAAPATAGAQAEEAQLALRQLTATTILVGADVNQLLKNVSNDTSVPKIETDDLELGEDASNANMFASVKNVLVNDEIVRFASTQVGRTIIQKAWDDTRAKLQSRGKVTVSFYDEFVDNGSINTMTAELAFKAATVTISSKTLTTGLNGDTANDQVGSSGRVAAE